MVRRSGIEPTLPQMPGAPLRTHCTSVMPASVSATCVRTFPASVTGDVVPQMPPGVLQPDIMVGHASLATGTVPAAHGMVANVWFDRARDRLVYNIEDPRYHLLTAGADVDRRTEIDPTQRTARSDGRSPSNILTSTLGDELVIHSAGRSKVFAVSVKDRVDCGSVNVSRVQAALRRQGVRIS